MTEPETPQKRLLPWLLSANAVVAVLVVTAAVMLWRGDDGTPGPGSGTAVQSQGTTTVPPDTAPVPTSSTSTTVPVTTIASTTTTTRPPYDGWVDPVSSGQPWSSTVEGLLTFRGNPTRTFYGEGPVPQRPVVAWSFPDHAMCSESTAGGVTKTWCGTGWTGQPAVWEREGRTWVAFGAYDRAVHVLDSTDGSRIKADFPTGDIIKGSVTIDPDGYPLLYTGSRDNFFRVLALDREGELVELWRLSANAVSPTKWNNDWDGAALIIDDYLFEGGENSQFHIVKLNRGYDSDGLVTVDPELVFNAPGWDDELIRAVGSNVSIENSVAISGNTVYFANSGGLVQGWDITNLAEGGEPTRVFRFWTGDDVDASVVIDDEGYLYVGAEYERGNQRSKDIGQIIKLDPSRPDDPVVWSVQDRDSRPGGIWATPAIYRDILIVPTDGGRVLGIDRQNGDIRWTMHLPGPLWQSPVVVDDTLIQGDCLGNLHAFRLDDTDTAPTELWSITLGGCIESTPTVWRGRIYVGTRGGRFFAVGDAG